MTLLQRVKNHLIFCCSTKEEAIEKSKSFDLNQEEREEIKSFINNSYD